MKKKCLWFASYILLASSAFASFEFTGYLGAEQNISFFLVHLESGEVSHPLNIGAHFKGCKVVSFDKTSETLHVQQGSDVLRLLLKKSTVRVGQPDQAEPAPLILFLDSNRKVFIDGKSIGPESLQQLFRDNALRSRKAQIRMALPPGNGDQEDRIFTAARDVLALGREMKVPISIKIIQPDPAAKK